jgi:RNA polymerase sigma factor (sigma-70 family)
MRPSDAVDWAAVTRRYADLVYSIPMKFGLTSHDCAEVFQNTWLVALGKTEAPLDDGMAPWLASIASWQTRDFLRKRRHQSLSEETARALVDEDQRQAVDAVAEAEEEQAVRDAMERMPERDREILRDLYLSGDPVPYAEIAQRLGLATGSIGMLRQRAIKRLEKSLQRLAAG